jgi:superfamily I DNA/RNA helicase
MNTAFKGNEFQVVEREYPPSAEQLFIFRYIFDMYQLSPRERALVMRNLVIHAVAGAGKSTTVIQLLQFLPKTPKFHVVYLTFMTASRDDLVVKRDAEIAYLKSLGRQVPDVDVRTIHSIGYGILRREWGWDDKTNPPTIDDKKYSTLVRDWLKGHMEVYSASFARSVIELVNKVQGRLTDEYNEEALLALIDEYAEAIEIDFRETEEVTIIQDGEEVTVTREKADKQWPLAQACLQYALKRGKELARYDKIITKNDMVWLVSSRAFNLYPSFTFNLVIVDECQDTSECEQEIMLKCVSQKYGGQSICVGDPDQAIYHFKGALRNGMDRLQEKTNAQKFYLKDCYRCGKDIVAQAQEFNNIIQAFAKSPLGTVEWLKAQEIERRIRPEAVAERGKPTVAVICRRRAPLIELYISLIKQGIRARLKGVDVGVQVITLLEKIEEHVANYRLDHLPQLAEDYMMDQLEILEKNAEENETKIDQLRDRTEMLLALFSWYEDEARGQVTRAKFIAAIERFFTEDEDAVLLLTTIHGCKGLEFDEAYILEAEDLYKRAQGSAENRFLAYVAVTRAKKYLGLNMKPTELDEICDSMA